MREGNHAVAVTVERRANRVSAGCRLSPEIKRSPRKCVLNAPSLLSFISQLWSILVST